MWAGLLHCGNVVQHLKLSERLFLRGTVIWEGVGGVKLNVHLLTTNKGCPFIRN